MKDAEDKRIRYSKLIIFLFLAVMLCVARSRPVVAGGDHAGKCSIKDELSVVDNILITKDDTDGNFGSIYYETRSGEVGILNLKQSEDGKMLPIVTLVNDISMRITDLHGAHVNSIKVSRRECNFSHPIVGNRHLSDQWIVQVHLID